MVLSNKIFKNSQLKSHNMIHNIMNLFNIFNKIAKQQTQKDFSITTETKLLYTEVKRQSLQLAKYEGGFKISQPFLQPT